MKHALLAATMLISPALADTCKPTDKGFTVTASGFTDPNGRPWSFRGINMDVPDAMPMMHGQFFQHFPGTTAIRLVVVPDRDSMETLDQIILYYTGKGIVVEIEDHADTQGGQNIGWYTQIAQRYKTNALAWGETPNEPAAGMTGAPQAAIINAMRAAGFNNPIGIQPIGGWDQSNIPSVLSGVTSKANLYVTPHVYCGDEGGPSCPTSYANGVAQPNNGLFPVIDEFGDALNGFTRNTYGLQVITAVINVAQAGKAGAAFWHAGNGFHPDGADSACQQEGCSSISITGKMLQPWLSGSQPQGACSLTAQTSAPPAEIQNKIDTIGQQTQTVRNQITKLQQAAPPVTQVQAQASKSPAPSFTGYNPTFVQSGQQMQQQLQSVQSRIQSVQSQVHNFDPAAEAAAISAQVQTDPTITSPAGTGLDPQPSKQKNAKRHSDDD